MRDVVLGKGIGADPEPHTARHERRGLCPEFVKRGAVTGKERRAAAVGDHDQLERLAGQAVEIILGIAEHQAEHGGVPGIQMQADIIVHAFSSRFFAPHPGAPRDGWRSFFCSWPS